MLECIRLYAGQSIAAQIEQLQINETAESLAANLFQIIAVEIELAQFAKRFKWRHSRLILNDPGETIAPQIQFLQILDTVKRILRQILQLIVRQIQSLQTLKTVQMLCLELANKVMRQVQRFQRLRKLPSVQFDACNGIIGQTEMMQLGQIEQTLAGERTDAIVIQLDALNAAHHMKDAILQHLNVVRLQLQLLQR